MLSMMRHTIILPLALTVGTGCCLPTSDGLHHQAKSAQNRSPWQPSVGSSWQIILSQKLILDVTNPTIAPNVDIFDIDMFSHQGTSTIGSLHKLNKRVICYFSAGSYEPARPDSALFIKSVIGLGLQGWPGEFWLDITSPIVRNIMAARILLAAQMGCDAVDPDNVDGYQNNNGLMLTAQHSVDYIKFLANEAAKYNMGIGLKNALDIIPDVLPYVQFAVNEQCAQYDECNEIQPFISAGKPVFHIEYANDGTSKRSSQRRNTDATQSYHSQSSTRLGCYIDSNERRVLKGDYDDDDMMTPQMCQQYCTGYTFHGLERGDQCYCSNTMASSGKQSDAECQTICTGDDTRTCGGRNRIEVYQTLAQAKSTITSASTQRSITNLSRPATTTTSTLRTTCTSKTTSNKTTATMSSRSSTPSSASSMTGLTSASTKPSSTSTKASSTTIQGTTTTYATTKTTSVAVPSTVQVPGSSSTPVCASFKNTNGFSTVIKKLDLDGWVQFCGGQVVLTSTL